ncbi:hypothetical protein [Janthinobacterium sp. LB3P118]|uniref:hypothetical protein n=1 Tax=Janthinobacterium sp. LB3P118 TaxID=3424195 RepID=UPI003F1E7FD4
MNACPTSKRRTASRSGTSDLLAPFPLPLETGIMRLDDCCLQAASGEQVPHPR